MENRKVKRKETDTSTAFLDSLKHLTDIPELAFNSTNQLITLSNLETLEYFNVFQRLKVAERDKLVCRIECQLRNICQMFKGIQKSGRSISLLSFHFAVFHLSTYLNRSIFPE